MEAIVDYVQIVEDKDGQFRAKGMSDNGEPIWTTEKYGDFDWAMAVALDTGKPVHTPDGGIVLPSE
jgi:hypothetical protein